ncbi:MAG: 2-C-methyl-D-erythritol 4-phosphate cytidylyltransferase, partial [Alistipes sp.]
HLVYWHNLSARFETAPHTVVAGGAERFYSVRNGLAALPDQMDFIAVHDGVRPLASTELIHRTLAAAMEHDAVIPVVEPTDSFRQTTDEGSQRIDRHSLRAVQTPQFFRATLLRSAYETEFSPAFTDDASVVEQSGVTIYLCQGDHRNLKITTPEDLLFAQTLLAEQEHPTDEPTENPAPHTPLSTEVCSGGYR